MGAGLFRDRTDAGRQLAEQLTKYEGLSPVVLAIPRGGVQIGFEIARLISAQFDLIIPRKIPIPWNPEAGFGAITADGTVVLNDRMVKGLGLSKKEIEQAAEEIRDEIVRRTVEYRGSKPPPSVMGRPVILADDGLASGYTMLAAIESLRKSRPSDIVVAAPVASSAAAWLVGPKVDKLSIITISERLPFSVADFYMDWRDLTDDEVLGYMRLAEIVDARTQS